MIDVDDHRAFKDQHGRIQRTIAIRSLANLLRESVRQVDVVARYGGEQYAIILPATPKSGALKAAEKLRAHVAMTTGNLTVSIGVATVPADCTSSDDLIRKADDALSRAKSLGKNRVEALSEERREFARYGVCLIGDLQVPYGDSMAITTTNISQGGFLINTNCMLQEGCVVHLQLSFGDERHPLTCIAEVVRAVGKSQHFEIGVKIIDVDASQFYEFKHFINNLPSSKRLTSH
jgi:diguanylate cyclase (GGDEF)-like protein